MHFKVALRNFHAFNASRCMVPSHVSGYYIRIVVVKMIRAAASGCLVQLVSNAKINPLPFQLDCNQGN